MPIRRAGGVQCVLAAPSRHRRRRPATPPFAPANTCRLPALHRAYCALALAPAPLLPCCRLERLIVKDFATQQAVGHKDKLLQSHRVRGMLDSIQDRSSKLVRELVGGL